MTTLLRVLIIEDSEDDAFLIKRELQRGGFQVTLHRVDTIATMRFALEQQTWDLVISDYNLPGFDGLYALSIFRSFGLDIPFLLISGAVGEEIAVDAMKAGAQDYIKKDNFSRLVPAVTRELKEVQVRRERSQVKALLDASEARYRTLVENIPIGVYRSTPGFPGKILMANPAFLEMFGLDTVSELNNLTITDLFVEPLDQVRFSETLLGKGMINAEEWLFRRRDGTPIWGMVTAQIGQVNSESELYFDCTIEDITSRRHSQQLQDALYQIAQAVNTTQTLDELISQIHKIIGGLMVATNFFLALLDESKQIINFPYFIDEKDKDSRPIKFGAGLTSLLIERGESLLVSPEVYNSMVSNGIMNPVGVPPVDWLGVPLKNRMNETIGALVVQSYSERSRYTENDRNILTFVSSQVAMVIERRQAEEALRLSETSQRALLDAIPDLLFVIDSQGKVKDYKAPIGMSVLPMEITIGQCIHDFFPSDVADLMLAKANKALSSSAAETFECELPFSITNNDIRSLEVRMSPSAEAQVLTLIRDISAKRQAEKNMEHQREFLRQVIDVNPNLIFAKDRSGRFTLANQAVAQVYGTTVENLIGKTDGDFSANPTEVEHFRNDDLEVIENQREKFIEEESMTDVEGVTRKLQTVKLPLIIPGSNDVQVLGVSTDITSTFQDSLTKLPNRRVFLDRLGRILRRSRRFGSSYSAVMMLDLDRFAMINESFGHSLGDYLLILAAHRLQTCLRTIDTVARFGGDEFAILVEDLESVNSITAIADRIMEEISQPFVLHDQSVTVSVSIGIVLCMPDYQAENVIRDADIALHRAKAAGKGRYELFQETMRENVRYNLQLELDLRQAIRQNELELHFEPIINLQTGRTVSLESLVRWRTPERGLIPPGRFIPLAEETGLILPIGDWVLRQACQLMVQWNHNYPAARDIAISVNLSTKQFLQDNLVEKVENILRDTGFDPNHLQLEITESVIIENESQVIDAMEKFRAMGIRIHMDDFGTGYSSLVYLHKLPLNAIKIDRSFISGSGNRLNGLEIVRTIIHLANDLHLETIAEGVETREQLMLLRGMGCHNVQGFLFTSTMSPIETEEFLRDQQGKYDWIIK
jgi:diguanylate cyclase (GGDEF)-like protein/PAS domain S-box-containing protein